MTRQSLLTLLLALAPVLATAGGGGLSHEDPLGSVQWSTMHRTLLNGEPVVFDPAVKVLAPAHAEDSLAVPVLVDATALASVSELLVFADLNPIPQVLRFWPTAAQARLGFRLKVQQGTAVRAAARTTDGVWHVGSAWVDAAGGGCTLPSASSSSSSWEEHLGEMAGRLWERDAGSRLRFSLVHPMDTGLAGNIPAFFVEQIVVTDQRGKELARIAPREPVAENPLFTLDLKGSGPLQISSVDNNGNRFRGRVLE